MSVYVTSFVLLATITASNSFTTRSAHTHYLQRKFRIENAPFLLPDPPTNSIGNFFVNRTDRISFIQCHMLAIGNVDGIQYGVGYPVDLPVMLTYFEDNQLKPVFSNYSNYDHLIDHVESQMSNNEFYLHKTPVVLTLQGEFEDEEFNNPYCYLDKKIINDDGEETSVEELLTNGEFDDNLEEGDEDYDDDDDDLYCDKNVTIANYPDLDDPNCSISKENPNISDNSLDDIVTKEDAAGLRRAHKQADKIIEYAKDVKLIGSYHYKKRNFHLVRLLEVIYDKLLSMDQSDSIYDMYLTSLCLLSDGEKWKLKDIISPYWTRLKPKELVIL